MRLARHKQEVLGIYHKSDFWNIFTYVREHFGINDNVTFRKCLERTDKKPVPHEDRLPEASLKGGKKNLYLKIHQDEVLTAYGEHGYETTK